MTDNQPDIDAAAERLRTCNYPNATMADRTQAIFNDGIELADYVVTQRDRERAEAEERAKPVSREFLADLHLLMEGDYETGEMPDYGVQDFGKYGNQVGVVQFNGEWQVVVNDESRDNVITLCAVRTTGQVLDLLRAMGVVTKRE